MRETKRPAYQQATEQQPLEGGRERGRWGYYEEQIEQNKKKIGEVMAEYGLGGHEHEYVVILFDTDRRSITWESRSPELQELYKAFAALLEQEIREGQSGTDHENRLHFSDRGSRIELYGERNDKFVIDAIHKILGEDVEIKGMS